MQLRNLIGKIDNIELFRDGEFESLGLVVSVSNKKLLSFVEKLDYVANLPEGIKCLLVNKEIAAEIPDNYGVIVSENPRLDFFRIHNFLTKNSDEYYPHGNKTVIGNNCSISPNACISEVDVVIGNNVVIEEFAVIRNNVVIGDNCIIRAGVVIGGVGFEFKRNNTTDILAVEHCGGVILEENVEIQYHTCVDKAIYPWDNTVIGEHSKLDNFVHVGHAAKIGKRNLLAANAVIGGRTVIKDDCWVGITTTIRNGLVIGNNANINMGAVVTKNVEENITVSGNFAIEHSKFINFIKNIGKV